MPDIFEEVNAVKRERKAAALATIVGGEKGSPGKTGFRMLVYPDGKISGTVGGGSTVRADWKIRRKKQGSS